MDRKERSSRLQGEALVAAWRRAGILYLSQEAMSPQLEEPREALRNLCQLESMSEAMCVASLLKHELNKPFVGTSSCLRTEPEFSVFWFAMISKYCATL